MKNYSRALATALASVLAVFLLAACAPSEAAAGAVTPAPEAAAALTAAPAAEATQSPSPEPTPIIDEFGFTEERKAELDQQIQDFLNYEGKYSRENIQKYLLPIRDSYYSLGLVNSGDSFNRVQPWLFDCMEKDGDLILMVGFDGKDNKRFITLLNVPLHFKETNPKAGVGFSKISEWNDHTNEESVGNIGDIDVIKSHLSKNKPMLIDFITIVGSDEEARNLGGDDFVTLNQYYRNNLFYTGDLISKVYWNEKTIDNILKLGNEKIQKIEHVSDISKINNATIPIVGVIIYVG